MSINLLTLIPTDTGWSPPAERDSIIVGAVAETAPHAEEIVVERFEEVSFVDAGANFERVLCPACGTELSVNWWQDRFLLCQVKAKSGGRTATTVTVQRAKTGR